MGKRRNKKDRINKKPRSVFNLFVLLFAVVTTLALYTGNSILWLFVFFLVGVLIIDLLLFVFFYLRIETVQAVSTDVIPCYSEILLSVDVKRFGALQTTLCYREDNKLKYRSFFQDCHVKLPQKEVGKKIISAERIYLKSALGLFCLYKNIDKTYNNNLECLVVPITRRLNIESEKIKNQRIQKGSFELYKTGFNELVGNREYVQGDPLSLINYKKSVMRKKTIVKDYRLGVSESVIYNIFVDSYDQKDLTAVAEGVLAVNNYYRGIGGQILILYITNGFKKIYDSDSFDTLSLDIAGYDYGENVNYRLDDIDTELPTALIISHHNDIINKNSLHRLPVGSMIYLSIKNEKTQELLKKNIDSEIMTADAGMLSEIEV